MTHQACALVSLPRNQASLFLGNRLFQQGCVNGNCKYPVEPCKKLGLTPATPDPDVGALEDASDAVRKGTQKLDSAQSFSNLTQNFFEVSAAAQSKGYRDAVELFERLAILTTETETLRGVEVRFKRARVDSCASAGQLMHLFSSLPYLTELLSARTLGSHQPEGQPQLASRPLL